LEKKGIKTNFKNEIQVRGGAVGKKVGREKTKEIGGGEDEIPSFWSSGKESSRGMEETVAPWLPHHRPVGEAMRPPTWRKGKLTTPALGHRGPAAEAAFKGGTNRQ